MVGRRAKEMEAVARRHRFAYVEQERPPARCADLPLTILCQGDGRPADNVITARFGPQVVRGFDYSYLADPDRGGTEVLGTDVPTIAYESGTQYLCSVVVAEDRNFPHVHIAARGRRRTIPAPAEITDVPGGKAFRKMFQLWAADPSVLDTLLDDEMVEFLLSTRGTFSFETNRQAAMVISTTSLKGEDVAAFMSLNVAFLQRIPQSFAATDTAPEPVAPSAPPPPSRDPMPAPSSAAPPPPPPPPPSPDPAPSAPASPSATEPAVTTGQPSPTSAPPAPPPPPPPPPPPVSATA